MTAEAVYVRVDVTKHILTLAVSKTKYTREDSITKLHHLVSTRVSVILCCNNQMQS